MASLPALVHQKQQEPAAMPEDAYQPPPPAPQGPPIPPPPSDPEASAAGAHLQLDQLHAGGLAAHQVLGGAYSSVPSFPSREAWEAAQGAPVYTAADQPALAQQVATNVHRAGLPQTRGSTAADTVDALRCSAPSPDLGFLDGPGPYSPEYGSQLIDAVQEGAANTSDQDWLVDTSALLPLPPTGDMHESMLGAAHVHGNVAEGLAEADAPNLLQPAGSELSGMPPHASSAPGYVPGAEQRGSMLLKRAASDPAAPESEQRGPTARPDAPRGN